MRDQDKILAFNYTSLPDSFQIYKFNYFCYFAKWIMQPLAYINQFNYKKGFHLCLITSSKNKKSSDNDGNVNHKSSSYLTHCGLVTP